ncbi:MAG: diguanylate cyclase [Burkholderiales bacterium]
MKWFFSKRSLLGFGLALLLIAVNIFVSHLAYQNTERLITAHEETTQLLNSLRLSGEVLQLLTDAETGQRGYLITGDERYLEPYNAALLGIGDKLKQLRSILPMDKSKDLAKLESMASAEIAVLNEMVALRGKIGFEAAQKVMLTHKSKTTMDSIRRLIGGIEQEQRLVMEQRNATTQSISRQLFFTYAVAALLNLVLLAVFFYIGYSDLRESAQDKRALRDLNEMLQGGMRELTRLNRESNLLSEMSEVLQSCLEPAEAYHAIAQFGRQLFPSEAGVFFVMHQSHHYLENTAAWGEPEIGGPLFAPEDCWALRRGQLHRVDDARTGLQCEHVKAAGDPRLHYMCVPMVVHSEILGLLHLQFGTESSPEEAAQRESAAQKLAATFADQVALAVANLRLRDSLRQQSIHDPLTGLHNRRYLEEALSRELARAERKKTSLAVIIIDVDHFKRFNDTFGHEAGDVVLRSLAQLIGRQIRGSDVACRFGGEEFVLVLPEANLSIARQRAELLREAAQKMQISHSGNTLGIVSISLGLAVFPQYGRTSEELIQAADAALYRAKQAGRNRVMIAEVAPPQK